MPHTWLMWAAYFPNSGYIDTHTVRRTRRESIDAFGRETWNKPWRKKHGIRLVRVTVAMVEAPDA